MGLKVCLILDGATLEEDLQLWERWRPWVDLVELRADCLQRCEWDQLGHWPLLGQVPCILTLRRREDGGHWSGSEDDYTAFYLSRTGEGWDWWDLDEQARLPPQAIQDFRARGGRVLRSIHAMDGWQSDAVPRLLDLARGADAVKYAVWIRTAADLGKLFELSEDLAEVPRVVIGMGPYGFPSRILGRALGSLWTYALPREGVGPLGQIDPRTLKTVLRVHRWEVTHPVFGVAGDPALHSKGPWVHNLGFERLGLDAIYLPFPTDDLEATLQLRRWIRLRGLSVTVPHKEAAATLAWYADATTRACGSANTLVASGEGWVAHNTDVTGFLRPLLQQWGVESLIGKRITVLGAGGAARAVVWALVDRGAEVLVLARREERAKALAEALGARWGHLGPDALPFLREHADAIVQATSAGMGDQLGVDPLEFYAWEGRELAYELVYNPPITRFLERAKAAGCPIIGGWEMFREQALEQFELFTGQEYPQPFPEFEG